MFLKTKDNNIEIAIKARNVERFEDMVCDEDETILSKLPQMAVGKGKMGFMATMINFFQVGNKYPIFSEEEYDDFGNVTKEKVYDCYDFIDDWCEHNEKSVTDLYTTFIREFDTKGVIDKGMGFQIADMIEETMKMAVENLKNNQLQMAITQTNSENVENG